MGEKIAFGICFPLMFCLVGGFFARSGYQSIKTKREKKQRCLSQTYGKIVSISSMKTGKKRSYFPTYEYNVNGKVITIEMKMGTTHCQYRRGDSVKIFYDSHEPQYSYIENYKEDTVTSIGCIVLGSLAIISGLFVGFIVW